MKVFTAPVTKVPPLLESDIENKIILSKMESYIDNTVIINYIIKDKCGIIRSRDYNISHGCPVVWSDKYGHGNTILDLLIKQYKILSIENYNVSYYIIESEKELRTFLKENNIKSNDISNELLDLWKKIENKNKD